ncbi:unnamed protein product [Bursaphelenchus xylophilus]|uniref:(pine wood nematode) hypothetical protein n=1 Tax=Bursaphelenchus xylophilus TaxID=6326 RepID=A0A1I7RTL6_BURXY|nr:unnamed protein product [Bursaphelenchus xylophilus]CAG9122341.1 unnamed protein product [Bursaphelenchus xylophilus]
MSSARPMNPRCYQEFILHFMEAYITEMLRGVGKRTRNGRRVANMAMWRLLLMNSKTASVFKNVSIKFLLPRRKDDQSIYAIWARRADLKYLYMIEGLFSTTINNRLIVDRFFGRQVHLSPKALQFWFEKGTLPLFKSVTLCNRTASVKDILRIDAISTSITIIRRVEAAEVITDYSQFCQRSLELNFNTRALRFVLTLMANLDLTHPKLENFTFLCTNVCYSTENEILSDNSNVNDLMTKFQEKPRLDSIAEDLVSLIPMAMCNTKFKIIFVFEEDSPMVKGMEPSYTPFFEQANVTIYYVKESQLLDFNRKSRRRPEASVESTTVSK